MAQPPIVIDIGDNQNAFAIHRAWYRALAEFVLVCESVDEAELSVTFVDNAAIHELNRGFLKHDYPTDVITFPLSEPDELLVGEIVISTEYAVMEAVDAGWPAWMEAGLYLTHGILHLCGYDDHDEVEAQAMAQRQELLLRDFVDDPSCPRYSIQAETKTPLH